MWIACMKASLTPLVGSNNRVLGFDSEDDAKKYIQDEIHLSVNYFCFWEIENVADYPLMIGTTGSGECPRCHLRWIVRGTNTAKDIEVHFILNKKCRKPCTICAETFKLGQSFV